MPKNDDATWKSVAVIGVIGMGFWYLIGKMQSDAVSQVASGIGSWWTGLWSGSPDTPQHQYDEKGCLVGVSSWCESLHSCVPVGLTCPTLTPGPVVPTTDPTQCSSGWSWCEKQGHCVVGYLDTPQYCDPSYLEPWEIPTVDPGYIPGQVDRCTWPNGDVLTVPAGMDCNQAVADMCRRFSSIPGYKGCP